MSPFYSFIAVMLVFTQRTQASYGHMHGGFVGDGRETLLEKLRADGFNQSISAFPVAAVMQPAPVVAPVMAAPVVQAPVIAAPPPVMAAPVAPVFPYAVHSHHYHPRAAIHNHVRAYHSESGHFSDTSMLLPFGGRRWPF